MTQSKVAILTGDLVHSTDMGREGIARAFAALEACARVQEGWHGAPLHFTRHRGDGWQVVLTRPELALRSALAFRAALRAADADFDSYMGISEGDAPDRIGPDLNDETGELFVMSGSALEAAKRARTDVRLVHEGGSHATKAVFALADHISRDWTGPQASAFLLMLDPDRPNFTRIAEKLGKSRQAVSKALIAAGLNAVTFALTAMEAEAEQSA